MYGKKVEPPYVPELESRTDTSHFDEEIKELPIRSPNSPPDSLERQEFGNEFDLIFMP